MAPDPERAPASAASPRAARARLPRRTFLTGAGAAVLSAVGGCLSQRAGPDPRVGPRPPTARASLPAGPALPGQYALGAPTRELLAREGARLQAPRGTFATGYVDGSPPAGTTWDLRRARFLGYYDKDALYETNGFADGSTQHQKNNRPIELGGERPVAEGAVVGGLVAGAQPAGLTWERMKYGQDVQDDTDRWVDAGRPAGVDPHEAQVGNRNQDGDPRMHVQAGSWVVWDGVRLRNGHDGIGLYRGRGEAGAGTCYIRNCWFEGIRDDAVENDDWHDLHVFDTLVDGTYTFLSALREGDDREVSGQTVRVEGTVVRLRPFPGGYKTHSSDAVHGVVYKMRPNSPALVLRSVTIACERFRAEGSDGAVLPERRGPVTDVYEDVTLVWLGRGPYPGNVPHGCRLTTDPAVYRRAVQVWKARHGVGPDGRVDLDRLLAPRPPLRLPG